jgi:hypothetical protein
LTREDPELSPLQHIFAIFRHFIEPLFDFFTAFTLLSLFYLLSLKAIESHNKKKKQQQLKLRLHKGEGEVTNSIINEL